jgi:hypothetical protein
LFCVGASANLGCLGPWPFGGENLDSPLLDFLGFPWILSSESRHFNLESAVGFTFGFGGWIFRVLVASGGDEAWRRTQGAAVEERLEGA